jgi:GNAT superfamily N-acetyltransferase
VKVPISATFKLDYELDDDVERIDVDAVHSFLHAESYWARGQARETTERCIREAARVVGLYEGDVDVQVGFARVVSDRCSVAVLEDVYVLEPCRGAGLGGALVRFAVVGDSELAKLSWFLTTRDGHDFYRKLGLGFEAPGPGVLNRQPCE